MNQREAQAVWNRLRGLLLGAEQALEEIVQTRAWEPLGYPTFAEAWKTELKGVRLTGVIQHKAVYALFDSGATVEEVQEAVAGVGPVVAEKIKGCYDKGIDAEDAERIVSVRSYKRAVTSPQSRIMIENLSEDQIADLRKVADEKKIPYRDLARHYLLEGLRKDMR